MPMVQKVNFMVSNLPVISSLQKYYQAIDKCKWED